MVKEEKDRREALKQDLAHETSSNGVTMADRLREFDALQFLDIHKFKVFDSFAEAAIDNINSTVRVTFGLGFV